MRTSLLFAAGCGSNQSSSWQDYQSAARSLCAKTSVAISRQFAIARAGFRNSWTSILTDDNFKPGINEADDVVAVQCAQVRAQLALLRGGKFLVEQARDKYFAAATKYCRNENSTPAPMMTARLEFQQQVDTYNVADDAGVSLAYGHFRPDFRPTKQQTDRSVAALCPRIRQLILQ